MRFFDEKFTFCFGWGRSLFYCLAFKYPFCSAVVSVILKPLWTTMNPSVRSRFFNIFLYLTMNGDDTTMVGHRHGLKQIPIFRGGGITLIPPNSIIFHFFLDNCLPFMPITLLHPIKKTHFNTWIFSSANLFRFFMIPGFPLETDDCPSMKSPARGHIWVIIFRNATYRIVMPMCLEKTHPVYLLCIFFGL